jgi:UMF1 family MFS transporter
VGEGLRKISSTIRNIRRLPTLARYTVAFLLFNDGIQTVIVMAGPYAEKVLAMGPGELIRCFLLIQGVAFVGALAFGWIARRFRDKPTLVVSLLLWLGVVVYAFRMDSPREFWILGVIVGLVLGGSQAIARSLQARFTPPSCAGEFFGFFSITGKCASALGPLLYAGVLQATGSPRWAILSIVVPFAAGLGLLLPVSEQRGVEEMEAEEARLSGRGGTA